MQYPQKEGIIGGKEPEKLTTDGLLADPFLVNSFVELVDFMWEKAAPTLRKIAFERMLKKEEYIRDGDVFFMKGSTYSITEQQTATKLTKAGYFVVFPGSGQIKNIKVSEGETDKRKNDAYIYHKKSYKQYKVDLKTSGDPSIETVAYHINSGSGQAPVVVLDITGRIGKTDLITAIRSGWVKRKTKTVLLNYKGQWYDINQEKAFAKEWMKDKIK